MAALLARYGLPVRTLRPADVRARSSHPFDAVDDDGRRCYVKVLDPDRFERDWLYRLYRLLTVRDIKDADAVAPLGQQAEHEAVAAMTARERGVRVPPVILARGNDRGAVVVQEYVRGRPLDDLSADERGPDLLRAIWQQVALLRDGPHRPPRPGGLEHPGRRRRAAVDRRLRQRRHRGVGRGPGRGRRRAPGLARDAQTTPGPWSTWRCPCSAPTPSPRRCRVWRP